MNPVRFPMAALAVCAAMGLAACGTSPGTSGGGGLTPQPGPPSSAGVTLQPPAGWTFRVLTGTGGVMVAATAADLSLASPEGPKLVVQPSTLAASPDFLIAHVERGPMFNPTASQQTFGDHQRVPVLRFATAAAPSQGETMEVLAIAVAPGKAYLFTLEAPTPAWGGSQASLEGVVSSATFNPQLFPN